MSTETAVRIAAAELYRELPTESELSLFDDPDSIHYIGR